MKRALPLRWWAGVIAGEPASKANSRRMVRRGGKVAFIKSQKALDYVDALRFQVPRLPEAEQLRGTLKLTARVFYASRRPDLDISLILDALQDRIYQNDRQVREMHLYHGLDRTQPRTELHIEEVLDDDDHE